MGTASGAGDEQRGPRTAAEATAALADVPASELRRSLLRWGRTLEPFWLRAVDVIGAHAGYAPHLHERYRESARGAFAVMEAQLDGARVLVKHRSAVDSGISALSAGIMRSWATDHAFAPWCDHAASVLRTCLRASAPSTPDEDVPGAVTAALLDLAAVRTGFPLSHYEVWSTATTQSMAGAAFAATAGEPEDWYRVSAEHLGCSAEAEALLREARSLWAAFPGPAPPLDVPEHAWTTTSDVSGCPICDPARA